MKNLYTFYQNTNFGACKINKKLDMALIIEADTLLEAKKIVSGIIEGNTETKPLIGPRFYPEPDEPTELPQYKGRLLDPETFETESYVHITAKVYHKDGIISRVFTTKIAGEI